jgi:hypothetical protein
MNWIWVGWTAAIVVSFAVFESYALANGKMTLSRATWDLTKAWPPLPFAAGLLVGGLAVHFWWNWCPQVGFGPG